MGALALRFENKLENIKNFWLEKQEKEKIEAEKKQNDMIIQKLGLSKMFQDTEKRNALFNIMNSEKLDGEFKETNSIFKTAKKSNEIYNKTFDSMDNGNFKPLLFKLFDVAKKEIKDKVIDSSKDKFEEFFGGKLEEAKDKGLGNNFSDVKELVKDVKEASLKDFKETTNNTQKPKKNYERMRLRSR